MTKYVLNGRTLRNLRNQRGMSQRELAELVGYTGPSSVVRIEKGERVVDWGKVVQIAEIFEVNPDTLILETIEDDGTLPTNYASVLRAVKAAQNEPAPSHESSEQVSIDDISKRLASIEKYLSSIDSKEKPTTLSGDELTQEEIDLIKRFRASSDQQRKAALAAANAILSENL